MSQYENVFEQLIGRRPRRPSQRMPIAGPHISMSQPQIAKAMGVSKTMVQKIERRALRKIQQQLKDDGFPDSWFVEQE